MHVFSDRNQYSRDLMTEHRLVEWHFHLDAKLQLVCRWFQIIGGGASAMRSEHVRMVARLLKINKTPGRKCILVTGYLWFGVWNLDIWQLQTKLPHVSCAVIYWMFGAYLLGKYAWIWNIRYSRYFQIWHRRHNYCYIIANIRYIAQPYLEQSSPMPYPIYLWHKKLTLNF